MNPKAIFKIPKKINIKNIKESLQSAVELELATIPTYLYTYYSIKRSWKTTIDPNDSQERTERQELVDNIKNDLELKTTNTKEKEEIALNLARSLQVYANKAAALIMSVVVEEMLHLALASNVKQAIVGPPLIYIKVAFPTTLPEGLSTFEVNLDKFSKAQLLTFMKIESPKSFKENEGKAETIGQFYHQIEQCILNDFPGTYTNKRPQLVPEKNYYAQNTTNTIYYDKDHKPQFPNADDSGGLIHVVSCNTALVALDEIIEQGEGHDGGDHLDINGNPKILPRDYWDNNVNPEDYDDPDQLELSHFVRFLELYNEAYYLDNEFRKQMGLKELDPEDYTTEYCFTKYFVKNQPKNPHTNGPGTKNNPITYENNKSLQDFSNMANAIFSYILLMIETCYYQADNTQYEVFMMGVHKSMIWLLTPFGNKISKQFNFLAENGQTYDAAVTFEFYDFSKKKSRPKQQLMELAKKLPTG